MHSCTMIGSLTPNSGIRGDRFLALDRYRQPVSVQVAPQLGHLADAPEAH